MSREYKDWLKSADAIMVNDDWVCISECHEVLKIDDVFMRLSHMNDFGEVEEMTIIKEALDFCYFDKGSLYIANKNGEPNKLDKLILEKKIKSI